ncbi:MAG TPA: PD-(D/E)XK nuclease family protein [Acidothermaceae bacterium]|jgi:RecB family exonuclease
MTATGELELEGLPQRLFSCTPSRLTTWVDCPRHYRMKYLDRPRPTPGPPWAHNSLGASVHNALAGWWRLPPNARTAEAAAQLLDAGWLAEGFRDEQQSAGWRDRAREMVRRYAARLDPRREPVGVERTLGARTRRLALSGRVDRLDDRDGELVVVDYKTGRRPPTLDDARGSAALALYAVAAGRTLRRPCHLVELHHVPTGEVVTWRHTDESLARQVRRAEDVADEIVAAGVDPTADTFPARPGAQCGWCTYRAHCAEGQRAAPAREPWAALDEPAAS